MVTLASANTDVVPISRKLGFLDHPIQGWHVLKVSTHSSRSRPISRYQRQGLSKESEGELASTNTEPSELTWRQFCILDVYMRINERRRYELSRSINFFRDLREVTP